MRELVDSIPPLVATLCADGNAEVKEAKEAAAVALANLSAKHNAMAVSLFNAIPPLVDMLIANEADEGPSHYWVPFRISSPC